MCLDTFLKVSKGNNLISKSRAFHNVGAAYTKDLSKNELAHVLLIRGTHNKQGSKDARVRIVVLLTLSLIKSHKYCGAVLLINCLVCQKQNFKNNSVVNSQPMQLSQNGGDVVMPWDTFCIRCNISICLFGRL